MEFWSVGYKRNIIRFYDFQYSSTPALHYSAFQSAIRNPKSEIPVTAYANASSISPHNMPLCPGHSVPGVIAIGAAGTSGQC